MKGDKTLNRRLRAADKAARRMTEDQQVHVATAPFVCGRGYIVERRMNLPTDAVENFPPCRQRLSDPFGIDVRDACVAILAATSS